MPSSVCRPPGEEFSEIAPADAIIAPMEARRGAVAPAATASIVEPLRWGRPTPDVASIVALRRGGAGVTEPVAEGRLDLG